MTVDFCMTYNYVHARNFDDLDLDAMSQRLGRGKQFSVSLSRQLSERSISMTSVKFCFRWPWLLKTFIWLDHLGWVFSSGPKTCQPKSRKEGIAVIYTPVAFFAWLIKPDQRHAVTQWVKWLDVLLYGAVICIWPSLQSSTKNCSTSRTVVGGFALFLFYFICYFFCAVVFLDFNLD